MPKTLHFKLLFDEISPNEKAMLEPILMKSNRFRWGLTDWQKTGERPKSSPSKFSTNVRGLSAETEVTEISSLTSLRGWTDPRTCHRLALCISQKEVFAIQAKTETTGNASLPTVAVNAGIKVNQDYVLRITRITYAHNPLKRQTLTTN